jgi:hypothetical protein
MRRIASGGKLSDSGNEYGLQNRNTGEERVREKIGEESISHVDF